jgi:uncharacterized repeat protein (TIGR01451 family)
MARFLILVGLITTGLVLTAASNAQEMSNADLAIVSNTANVKDAKVGNEVTFTIIATNHGPDYAELDVTWSSEQMQLVSETCDHGISADTPACEYGFVRRGHSRTTTVVARVVSTGSKHAVGRACVVEQAGLIDDPHSRNNCAAARVKIVGVR